MAPEGVTTMPSQGSTQIEVKVTAVIFPEGDQYIAQGLEFDICVFGKTIEIAQRRFVRALMSTAAATIEQNKTCMQDIPAAPQKYWDMFKRAHLRVERVEHEDAPIRTPLMPPPALRPTFRYLEAA